MGRARVHSGSGSRCGVDSDVDSVADSGVEEATGGGAGAGEVESGEGPIIKPGSAAVEAESGMEEVAGSRARMMNVSSFRPRPVAVAV